MGSELFFRGNGFEDEIILNLKNVIKIVKYKRDKSDSDLKEYIKFHFDDKHIEWTSFSSIEERNKTYEQIWDILRRSNYDYLRNEIKECLEKDNDLMRKLADK